MRALVLRALERPRATPAVALTGVASGGLALVLANAPLMKIQAAWTLILLVLEV